MKGRRVAVIGGGLAGLAAGFALERRGANVVVYEAADRLGGRAMTDDLDGLRIDPAAQLFGSMYQNFLQLTREIGLGERLVRVPGRDALWREGRAHEVVYGSTVSMAASGGLPLLTKFRLASTYVPFLTRHADDLVIDAPEKAARAGLDGESIEEWGRREMDDPFLRALVYPQLAAYYAASPTETSAGFYHILARYGMNVSLFALDGGVAQVADRLASRAVETGGEVRLGARVRRVEMAGDRVTVSTDDSEETFYGAVAALPAPLLPPILRGAPAALMEWLDRVRYRPAVALALVLRSPTRERFFGLSFPRGETRYVSAVAVQENKGVPLGDTQRGVLIAFPTPESAADLVEMESRDILNRMLPEVAVVFPGIEDRLARVRAYRWKEGAPLFYPGYLGHLGEFRRGGPEGTGPLAVAGDYLYGPSVEGAVTSGLAAAERLVSRMESRS